MSKEVDPLSTVFKKRKEAAKMLSRHLGKHVIVSLRNNKDIRGYLKGVDNNLNLVIASANMTVHPRDTLAGSGPGDVSRDLGLLVVRGTWLSSISSGEMRLLDHNPFEV